MIGLIRRPLVRRIIVGVAVLQMAVLVGDNFGRDHWYHI